MEIPPGSTSRSRRRPSCLTTRSIPPLSSPFSPDWPTRANVYPGFPATQTLGQALRPYPQWNGIPPFLGPPDGNTWYDSLQIKATQRFQHGLSAQVAYTWQKELTNGTNSNTSYVTPSPPLINDVFNKALDKQISGFSIPQELIISFNYTTPRIHGDSTGMKALSWAARDWTMGGVLRYQSGQLIQTPGSRPTTCSRICSADRRTTPRSGAAATRLWIGYPVSLCSWWIRTPSFRPTTQQVLNPAAWTEAPFGTFGASAPYFNDFRWQRQPAESLAFGRTFPIKEKYKLQIRAEFQNIFNRLFYATPQNGSAFGAAPVFTTSPTVRGNTLSGTTGLCPPASGSFPG